MEKSKQVGSKSVYINDYLGNFLLRVALSGSLYKTVYGLIPFSFGIYLTESIHIFLIIYPNRTFKTKCELNRNSRITKKGHSEL